MQDSVQNAHLVGVDGLHWRRFPTNDMPKSWHSKTFAWSQLITLPVPMHGFSSDNFKILSAFSWREISLMLMSFIENKSWVFLESHNQLWIINELRNFILLAFILKKKSINQGLYCCHAFYNWLHTTSYLLVSWGLFTFPWVKHKILVDHLALQNSRHPTIWIW